MAAEDVVAAEGADGGDLVGGGGEGAVIELLALSGGGFGGQEAAVGWRDDAAADGVEQEGEQGEDPEDVACARAGAIGGPTRVGGLFCSPLV